MKPSLSVTQILSFAWNTYKKQPILYTLLLLIIPNLIPFLYELAASFLLFPLTKAIENNPDQVLLSIFGGGISLIRSLISFALSSLLLAGITLVSLKIVRGEDVSVKMIFSQKRAVLPFLLTSIIVGAIAVPAFLLFIIPGIIWMIATSFAYYFIIDKGMGPIQALQASLSLTKGSRLKLFGWGCLMLLLSFIGAIPVLLGLLVVLPLSNIGIAKMYSTLLQTSQSLNPVLTAESVASAE